MSTTESDLRAVTGPDSPQPGVDPTAPQTVGTMFAALYGKLVPHDWRGPEPEGDAYSLFYQRSLAMGWLDGLGRGTATASKSMAPGGLWSMNDAGWDHPLAPAEAQLAAWFQVEVEAVARDRPLPVQPFLRCGGDAMDRVGVLELKAAQLLLPVHGLDASIRPPEALVPSMQTIYWFRESNPRSRVEVEVNVNSGQDPLMSAVARQFTDRLDRLSQNVFVCTSSNVGTPEAVMTPPFEDSFWNGPPLHGLTLRGDLSEWTLDAIGWLGEVIADIGARLGIRTPLLLTVIREGQRR
jgi:hypothetical protein